MGKVINCPNLRYEVTKKGGFLGIGEKGGYYCSCDTSQWLADRYMNERCCGRREAKSGDDPRYVCTYSNGRSEASGFLDCPTYRMYGIRN